MEICIIQITTSGSGIRGGRQVVHGHLCQRGWTMCTGTGGPGPAEIPLSCMRTLVSGLGCAAGNSGTSTVDDMNFQAVP